MKSETAIKLEPASALLIDLKRRLASALPPVDQVSETHAREILARYAAGVSSNFIVWLAALVVSARSLEARFAAEENIRAEISEDHPEMLREFVESSGCKPSARHFNDVLPLVQGIQERVSDLSSSYLVALVHGLEELSLVYIPWLGELSRRLGNTNTRYADIHGEADIHHARQLRQAVVSEAKFTRASLDEVAEGYDSAFRLIHGLVLDPVPEAC